MAEPLVLTRPLTVADYVALGADRSERYELREGSLVISPSPRPEHVAAMGELFVQLRAAAPAGLRVLQDIDVDLQLAAPEAPGTVRRPDLIVVTEAEYAAARQSGALLPGGYVLSPALATPFPIELDLAALTG